MSVNSPGTCTVYIPLMPMYTLPRYLYIPLMTVERAWSYAMQLKQEANTEHRKKYHLASRLRKAAQLVDLFQKLTDEVRKEKGQVGGRGGREGEGEGEGEGRGMRGLWDGNMLCCGSFEDLIDVVFDWNLQSDVLRPRYVSGVWWKLMDWHAALRSPEPSSRLRLGLVPSLTAFLLFICVCVYLFVSLSNPLLVYQG